MQSSNPYLILFNADANREAARKIAMQNAPSLCEEILKRDRFQPSWALKNMIKALSIHSWLNTQEEWQRYFESKIILKVRTLQRLPKNLEKSLK